MREKHLIWVLSLMLVFTSCDTKVQSKQKPKVKIDLATTKSYNIKEANVTFNLPNDYVKTTAASYKNMIGNYELSEAVKQDLIKTVDDLKSDFAELELLVDKASPENIVWISKGGPHIELNQKSVQVASQWYTRNIDNNEQLLQKNVITKQGFKYLKLKIKKKLGNEHRFLSHFLISTDENTVGISFSNAKNIDFQDYINLLEVGK